MLTDIELGERRVDRRVSFIDRMTPTRGSKTSPRTNTFATIAGARDRTVEASLSALTDDERQRQDCLLALIVGDNLIKGSLADACIWYSRFLRHKLISHWHLLAPTLVGLDDDSTGPRQGDLVVAFNFAITVARLLKTQSNLALAEIVDGLENEQQLKQQLDSERALHNQAVFAVTGWLTMIYEAVNKPEADKLEITRTSTASSGRTHPLTTRKIRSHSQGFDHVDRSLEYLLSKFGDLIPGPKVSSLAELGEATELASEAINVQTLCFHHLNTVVEIKIEWVTSHALHLEFDSGRKTLKLFQYPSFARLMSEAEKNGLLSKIFNDHAAANCEDVQTPEVPASEYFEEILLSYRLIFGLDEKSWRSFSRIMTAMEEQEVPGDLPFVWDPLLQVLCGKSATSEEAQRIYDDIEASEPAKTYPYTEFPFFSKRLIALQDFVKQHQPQNVRSLLNDKRDVAAWYTLWSNQVCHLLLSLEPL
ncbi:hypothetical protein ONS95_007254 [Cadophora gregata]|uniref:uncharacterized protein n=1 Tax=Cadophora gregata TaxID=51156 RepID=UPI0026DC74EF|nr:uncharacterized protein ONS95_007254 [Cadophora gregata]KAK0100807.1 hypothetical protein ONS95_007254 [Cadophora gregata]